MISCCSTPLASADYWCALPRNRSALQHCSGRSCYCCQCCCCTPGSTAIEATISSAAALAAAATATATAPVAALLPLSLFCRCCFPCCCRCCFCCSCCRCCSTHQLAPEAVKLSATGRPPHTTSGDSPGRCAAWQLTAATSSCTMGALQLVLQLAAPAALGNHCRPCSMDPNDAGE